MPSRSREAAASTKKKRRRSPLPWILLVLVAVVGGYRLYTGYFPFQPRQSLDGQTISSETPVSYTHLDVYKRQTHGRG